MTIRKKINQDNLQYRKLRYQTLKTLTPITNNINKMICNKSKIQGDVTCLPDSVIYEIRDVYNASRIGAENHIVTNDIVKIVQQLYYIFTCETEETFLSILPDKKRKEYTYTYFAPGLLIDEKDKKVDGGSQDQFAELFYQFEDLYEDYVHINYLCTNNFFHTVYNCSIDFNNKYKEEYTNGLLNLSEKDLIDECNSYTHIELMRILHSFMKLDRINQISIAVMHSGHAQSVYINKKEKIFYCFDSSVFHSDQYEIYINSLNTSIRREIGSILVSYSSQYALKINKQQQYLEGACVLHVIIFIITMIDPTMTMKQKLTKLNEEIDNDDNVRQKIYNYLNPNMINIVMKKTSIIPTVLRPFQVSKNRMKFVIKKEKKKIIPSIFSSTFKRKK